MLQPIKHKNTVEIAIDNIGEYIINNFHVGDGLPSERKISEQLQISRNITREALQHYRTLGIIEAKPKVGTVIVSLTPQKAFEGYLPFLSIMEHGMEDLAQLRLMLELGAAELAVDNVTAEDIEILYGKCRKMEELYKAYRTGKTECMEELFNLDLEFHSFMLNLSHNKLVESLVPLVVEFFSRHLMKQVKVGKDVRGKKPSNGYGEHFQLVEALEKHDLPGMQKLIRAHIYNSYIKKIKNSNGREKRG